MRRISTAIACILLGMPVSGLADPAGTFDVRGINPDNGGEYKGTVSVRRTGETYNVVWKIGNDELTGTGIGLKMVDGQIVMSGASEADIGISIAYGSGDSFGTVVYFEQPDGRWHGTWAYHGWDHLSSEDWFPRNRKKIAKTETAKGDKKDEKPIRAFESQQSISTPMPALAGPKS